MVLRSGDPGTHRLASRRRFGQPGRAGLEIEYASLSGASIKARWSAGDTVAGLCCCASRRRHSQAGRCTDGRRPSLPFAGSRAGDPTFALAARDHSGHQDRGGLPDILCLCGEADGSRRAVPHANRDTLSSGSAVRTGLGSASNAWPCRRSVAGARSRPQEVALEMAPSGPESQSESCRPLGARAGCVGGARRGGVAIARAEGRTAGRRSTNAHCRRKSRASAEASASPCLGPASGRWLSRRSARVIALASAEGSLGGMFRHD